MACLVDGAMAEIGSLCRACAQRVPPAEGLIADVIFSKVPAVDAEAWLVDGFGNAHALGPKSTIGRDQDGKSEVVILAKSVSREHAELRQADNAWSVRDLGSHNGTYVDGSKIQRGALPNRAVIKFGEVAMWFLSEVVDEPVAQATMPTQTAGNGLVRYVIAPTAGTELCLVANNDTTVGGTLLSRTGGADWGNHELPPLEFQLLRALCVRARAEADAPSAARGCVPTKQLARDLPFQSKYANEENVRQVVRRLRAQLAELGSEKILAVVPGRGYYLACPVTSGAER